MDVTQIPFVKHTGIKNEEGRLKLEATDVVQNHMETIHASAQFTLAETQSGLCLQETFPELEGKVLAVLRGSTVKYKNPAISTIYATASIEKDIKNKFLNQLERKRRATIVIGVQVLDEEEILTMQGNFTWFVKKNINKNAFIDKLK